jgi:hypothetical protein
MAVKAALIRHGRAGHGVLQSGDGPAVALAAGLVRYMLAVVLDQGLEFSSAGVEHTGKIQRDVGRMVGIGMTELVGPVVKQLPLVCAFFWNLDGVGVHVSSTKSNRWILDWWLQASAVYYDAQGLNMVDRYFVARR